MINLRICNSLIAYLLICSVSGQITESALSIGEIYKLTIPESGIYKIDDAFLQNHNITTSPNHNVHIYGRRGGVLPEVIAIPRIDDLIELPTYRKAGNNSHIIFFSEGADRWITNDGAVEYEKNVYDAHNYVYLTTSSDIPKSVPVQSITGDPTYITNTYEETQHYEVDNINPLGEFPTTHGSGQKWYGDEYTNRRSKEYTSEFDFTDIVVSDPIEIVTEFISRSEVPTTYEIYVDGAMVKKEMSSVRTGDIEAIHARTGKIDESFDINSSNPIIELRYPSVSATSTGWLDFIEVKFRKKLNFRGSPLVIRDTKSVGNSISEFVIDEGISSQLKAWDITNPLEVVEYSIDQNAFKFNSTEELRSFILFDENQLTLEPTDVEKIGNQNLHGLIDLDMVIVYHKFWEDQAKRLAQHRRDYSGLMVEAVDIDQIYNEFSSGRQDATAIRDFAKMLYDRSENFNFLLLFGDGSYDFRGINPELPSQNYVPTYETLETLNPLAAFPSDDYFAQLDDDEGIRLRGDLDIAVGRLPARNLEEATNLVDKLINYDISTQAYGDWRSRIAFLADDEDSNLHLNDADEIASRVAESHPMFNQKKIYWDAYPQESTPGGNRYPAANQQLNNDIEDGLLVVNYLGHGGPKGWSQERVLNLTDITAWSNTNKLPLIVTATCSFTGFDDPSLTTAGEETIHNPTGGAIALFTTVRSVYASQNFRLTKAVFDTLFTKVDGDYMTIGEVMRRAKNTRINDVVNARKFFLIGDPAMKLAIPRQTVTTTDFRSESVSIHRDTIGAKEKVHVQAQILDLNGNLNATFNGEVDITLFDKASQLQTLKNDVGSFEKKFDLQKNVLFKGKASVTNGSFEFTFIVPLDIDYSYGKGRISYYAVSENGEDAIGFYDDFTIGGTEENAVADDKGPQIEIKIEDENFTSGDQILKVNPMILVDLFDESGINVSNVSIGHEIVGIVDDKSSTTQVLNEKYISQIDNYTSGSLSYRLNDLEVGLHSLTIRAFDIFNNPGESKVEFEVIENLDAFLQSVIAFPNPFTDFTTFAVDNELGESVNLEINIYDTKGRNVKKITRRGLTNTGTIGGITWEGDSNNGNISTGIYMYDVLLESEQGEKSRKSGLKKLIVLK